MAQAAMVSSASAVTRFSQMGKAVLFHCTPWAYQGASPIYVVIAILSVVSLWYPFIRQPMMKEKLKTWGCELSVPFVWLIGLMLLAVVYALFFWATHFYARYSSPIILPATILIALYISRSRGLIVSRSRLLVGIGMVSAFFIWAIATFHTGRVGNTHVVTAGYLSRNYPHEKIGAFQSGVIGYFNTNVVNLDGKINIGALNALKEKQLHTFIDRERITVLADWPGYIALLDSRWRTLFWTTAPHSIQNGISICLQRKNMDIIETH
jgi:hypothetical protein